VRRCLGVADLVFVGFLEAGFATDRWVSAAGLSLRREFLHVKGFSQLVQKPNQ
jgi:hypothetical protein